MKILLVITAILILAGCTTPVKREFPPVPDKLMNSCPELIKAPDTTKLSEVLTVVVKNYGQYNECSIRVDGWRAWYTEQREIFNSVR